MGGDDDGKWGTWLEPRTTDKGDSQRGDPKCGQSVETWTARGWSVAERGLEQRPGRGPERGTETRLRPLHYGSRRGGETNDSIQETSCCVPNPDSGHTGLYIQARNRKQLKQDKQDKKDKQDKRDKKDKQDKQGEQDKTKTETRTETSTARC